MHRFQAIEGARGWLAWMVVLSHIGQILGLDVHGGHWVWFSRIGDTGVMVFIAISGFVITNLVVDKRERYPQYLLRRGFRIFPAYWIAYALALAVLPYAVASAPLLPLSGDPSDFWQPLLHQWQATLDTHPWLMVLSHLTLLHGVIPDSVILYSGTDVLGPAWSLTLEWQFYIVAPLMIWALASKTWRLPTVLLVALGVTAVRMNLFGHYQMPSVLAAAAYVFMIGIGCRLAFDNLKNTPLPPETPLVTLLIGLLYPDLLWLALWMTIYVYLLNAERWGAHPVARAIHAILESRPARYFGARSYSVYLFHLSILELATWWLVTNVHPPVMQFAVMLFAIAAPIILITSDVMYRLVEQPCIRLGAHVTRERAPLPA